MNIIDCHNLLAGKEKSLMQPSLERHPWKLARVLGVKSLKLIRSEKLIPLSQHSVAVMNPPFSMIWEFIGMALERGYAAIVAPHTTLVVPAKSKKNALIQSEFKRRLESVTYFPESFSHFGIVIAGGFVVAYVSPSGPKNDLCLVSKEDSKTPSPRDMQLYVSPDDLAQSIFDKAQKYIELNGSFNSHAAPRDLIRDPYGVGHTQELMKYDGTGTQPVYVCTRETGKQFERKYILVDPKHIKEEIPRGFPWGFTRGLDPGGVEKADSGRSKSNVLCPPWLGKEGDACGYTFVRGGCQPTLAEAQSQMESFYSKTDCAVIKMASGNSDFTRRIGDKLPWFDPARPWSEKEIQDELGLTTEERQWIEDHIESSL